MARAKTDKGRGKFTTRPLAARTSVGILLCAGAKPAAVHGLTDLFETANGFSAECGGQAHPEIHISHWSAHTETGQPVCVYESHSGQSYDLDCVIFPPTLDINSRTQTTENLLEWAKARHDSGALLCSVCGGAFALARLGLLNGRAATTHWSYSEIFATSFPEIRVNTSELIIDLGDVVTAGGIMAWLDLGLRLVDRYLGPVVMLKTAKFFLADPAGRHQRFYANFSPPLHHGDEAILKVQMWLQTSPAKSINIEKMAEKAKLGQRTFLRRFQKASGLTPTAYVHNLKVQKAREFLEFTKLSIKEISWKVGYQDTGAFRKTFRKLVGLTPTDYRSRFGASEQVSDKDLRSNNVF